MLIIKRIIASLINIFIFLAITLGLYPLLNLLRIEVAPKYFLFIVFCIVFFIPIIKLKSTIGNKITNTKPSDYNKLLVKYLLYYIIVSGIWGSYINIFNSILNINIFQNLSSGLLLFALLITFLIIMVSLFLFSGGKFNLIDFILKLSYDQKDFSRNIYLTLSTWFLSFYIVMFLGISIKKNFVYEFFESMLNPSNGAISYAYFPSDIFDDFSPFQIVKYNWNNEILTFSDESSFFQDRYLQQKTVYCIINKSTFESPLKRYELCIHLKYYSQIDDVFNDNETNPDQTKYVLIYNKPQTFFSVKTYLFKYFYDNQNPKHGIYGGVNLDSLSNEYIKQDIESSNKYNSLLAKALGISIDSLYRRTSEDGNLKINEREDSLLRNFGFSSSFSDNYFVLDIIPFFSVKPDSMLNFSFPNINQYQVNLTDNNYFDEKLYKAIYLRDLYFYNK